MHPLVPVCRVLLQLGNPDALGPDEGERGHQVGGVGHGEGGDGEHGEVGRRAGRLGQTVLYRYGAPTQFGYAAWRK